MCVEQWDKRPCVLCLLKSCNSSINPINFQIPLIVTHASDNIEEVHTSACIWKLSFISNHSSRFKQLYLVRNLIFQIRI
jgi:hypothetical protein